MDLSHNRVSPIQRFHCTNIKHRANGKVAISQANRTCTLKMSLQVANVSEVLNKSLVENTLMRQVNNKVVVKCNLLGMRNLGIYLND